MSFWTRHHDRVWATLFGRRLRRNPLSSASPMEPLRVSTKGFNRAQGSFWSRHHEVIGAAGCIAFWALWAWATWRLG